MKIKRYMAPSMRAALDQVRAEQGEDAVILSSRRVKEGIEVIAAVDYDEALMAGAARQYSISLAAATPPEPAAPPPHPTIPALRVPPAPGGRRCGANSGRGAGSGRGANSGRGAPSRHGARSGDDAGSCRGACLAGARDCTRTRNDRAADGAGGR